MKNYHREVGTFGRLLMFSLNCVLHSVHRFLGFNNLVKNPWSAFLILDSQNPFDTGSLIRSLQDVPKSETAEPAETAETTETAEIAEKGGYYLNTSYIRGSGGVSSGVSKKSAKDTSPASP